MGQPERLGDYALLERLAHGEKSDVYAASYAGPPGESPAAVAIKVAHAGDAEASAELLKEGALARQLSHPNIVPTLRLGEEDGRAYVVMERCDGASLATLLAESTALGRAPTPAQSIALADQLCDALIHAHEREERVLHLRVNPHNVLVGRGGNVWLSDFSVPRDSDATLPGKLLGPPAEVGYLAPEQVLGLPADGRADQFAVAVILWELLCGRALFANDAEVREARVKQPSRVGKGVPVAIDDVILRALAKDPDERYPGVASFRESLEFVLAIVAPDEKDRDLAPWIGPVLGREGATMDSTLPENTVPATIEVDPALLTAEVPPEVSLDVTERVPVAAGDGDEGDGADGDDLTSTVTIPPADHAVEHDPLDKTLPSTTLDKLMGNERPPGRAPPGAKTGDGDDDDDDDEPNTVKFLLTEPAPASPAAQPVLVIAGAALLLGLLGGAAAVWLLRDDAPERVTGVSTPESSAPGGTAAGAGDDNKGPTPSAETPSGRCGKAPVGDGYLQARSLVADARASLLQRDFVEAKRLLRHSLETAATSAAHFELGRLAIKAGDLETARRSFGCALVLAPESDDAQRAAVELAELQVDEKPDAPEEAVSSARASAQPPRGKRSRRTTQGAGPRRKEALQQLGRCESPCARLLRDAIGRRDSPRLDDNLTFAVEECLDQCKTLASRRVAKELSRTATRSALRGDLGAAEKAARRGLELNPRDAALHRLLGTVYKKQGKKTRAAKHFSRYLELSPGAPDADTVRAFIKESG